jgi:beta-glucosidase
MILNVNRLTKIELFRNFDNIGMQCGGWTVRWQGYMGNDFWKDKNKQSTNATSVLDALKSLQAKNNVKI